MSALGPSVAVLVLLSSLQSLSGMFNSLLICSLEVDLGIVGSPGVPHSELSFGQLWSGMLDTRTRRLVELHPIIQVLYLVFLSHLGNTDNFDSSVKNQNVLHTHRHLQGLIFMKLIRVLRIFMSRNLIHPHLLQARGCHQGGITKAIRFL